MSGSFFFQYIGHTSSECLPEPGKPLNSIPSASAFLEQVNDGYDFTT
jgi:hypothetical protein